MLTAGASVVAAATGVLLAVAAPQPAPSVVTTLADPRITESSGLVASRVHPGLLWSVDDGGRRLQVIGVDRSGRTRAVLTLRGVDPYDPEAMAPCRDGGRPALCIGDIGDNSGRRDSVVVFRVPEPARLGSSTATPTELRLRYADGPHDAETLLVDAAGAMTVVTKDVFGAGFYRPVSTPRAGATVALRRVAAAPPVVTDGAVLPDGRVALRTYSALLVLPGPGSGAGAPRTVLPDSPQGETLATDPSLPGGVLVGSEGARSLVYAVAIPGARDGAPPVTAPAATAQPSRAGRAAGVPAVVPSAVVLPAVVLLAVVLLGVVLLGVGLRARRRRPSARR